MTVLFLESGYMGTGNGKWDDPGDFSGRGTTHATGGPWAGGTIVPYMTNNGSAVDGQRKFITQGTAKVWTRAMVRIPAGRSTGALLWQDHLSVVFNSSYQFSLKYNGTIVAGPTVAFTHDVWYSVELGVTWDAAVGTAELWIDNTQYLSVTGQAFAASVAAVGMGWNHSDNSGSDHDWSDFVCNDQAGSQNNGRLGKCRVELLSPNGAGSVSTFTGFLAENLTPDEACRMIDGTLAGWTVTAGTTPTVSNALGTPPDGGNSIDISSNPGPTMHTAQGTSGMDLSGLDLTKPFSITYSAMVPSNGAGGSANWYVDWYDNGGTLISSSGPYTLNNLAIGSSYHRYTVTSITAPSTAVYASLRFDGSVGIFSGGAETLIGTIVLGQATLADSVGGTRGIPFAVGPAKTHWQNWIEAKAGITNGGSNDGDGSYTWSANQGDEDLATLDDLYETTGTVLAVNTYAMCRKEVSNPRGVKAVRRVGSTDYLSSELVLPNNLSYQTVDVLDEVNPATGVAWTIADVNALQAGVVIST